MSSLSSHRIQQEDIDALLHDSFLSSQKWTKQLSELSQLCGKDDASEALEDLIWQCSTVLKLRKKTESLIDITDDEKAKIVQFLAKNFGGRTGDVNSHTSSSSQSRLFATLLKTVSTVERNTVLARALQSHTFTTYKYRRERRGIDSSSLSDEMDEFCEKVGQQRDLRAILVLIKALLSVIEDNTLHSFQGTISCNSLSFIESLLVPGPEDLKSILAHESEVQRLQSFASRPRFVPSYGIPEKVRQLEVWGPTGGFITGCMAARNTGCYYFEGVLKGGEPRGMRIGWAQCCCSTSTVSSPPGAFYESWGYDGFAGAVYHNAEAAARALQEALALTLEDIDEEASAVIKESVPSATTTSSEKYESLNEGIKTSSTLSVHEGSEYASFVKLLRLGVPREAVKQRMITTGMSADNVDQLLQVASTERMVPTPQQVVSYDGEFVGLERLFDEEAGAGVMAAVREKASQEAIALGGQLLPCFADTIASDETVGDRNDTTSSPRSWKVDDTVGCLLDTDNNLIRVFVNGVEHGNPTICNVDIGLKGMVPVASTAPGCGFNFKIYAQSDIPEFAMKHNKSRESMEATKCVISESEIYSDVVDVRAPLKPVCIRLNSSKSDSGVGHILGNPKILDKITPTHSFCIELSARLDLPVDDTDLSGKRYSLLSFTGKKHSRVNAVFVDGTGAVYCDVFGKIYQSPDGTFKPNKWHNISVVYSTSRSTVAIVIDKVVVSMPRKEKIATPKNLKQMFCIGATITFTRDESSLPSESKENFSYDTTAFPESKDDRNEMSEVSSLAGSEDVPSARGDSPSPADCSRYEFSGVVDGWVGGICDVRVWSSSRSMQDITDSCSRSALTGSEKRLCAYWRLDEGHGSVAYDLAQVEHNWKPGHGTLLGDFEWSRFEPMRDISPPPLTNFNTSIDAVTEPESILVSLADLPSTSVRYTLQQGLARLCLKLYMSCSNFLGWKVSKGPKVLTTSKYYDVQLKSPGFLAISDPHVLTFLLLNSCMRQILRLISISQSNSGPGKLSLTSLLSIGVTLLRIVRVNIESVKDQDLSPCALGLKYSHPTRSGSSPFVATFLNSILAFVHSGNECSIDTNQLRALRNCVRNEAISVIVAGFHIFFPHISDQALMLECLLVRKHFNNPRFPRNDVSDEIHAVDEASKNVTISLSNLPEDPLVLLLKLSAESVSLMLSEICIWMSRTQGGHAFVSKFIPKGSHPLMKSPSCMFSSTKPLAAVASDEVSPQVGDIVERGPDWHYGTEDGGAGSRGIILSVFSWLKHYNGCGAVVKWSNGIKNAYCYGGKSHIGPGSGNKKYEISLMRPCTDNDDGQESKEDIPMQDTTPSRSAEKELLYTPDEVVHSLVEEVGELTKRTVIRYMKSIAPMEWQIQKKLSWTENTLVSKLSGEECARLYSDFYQKFSSSSAAVPAPPSASTFAASTIALDEPDALVASRFSHVLQMILLDVEAENLSFESVMSEGIQKSSYNLLCAIQAHLTGISSDASVESSQSNAPWTDKEVVVKSLEGSLVRLTPLKSSGEGREFLAWNWEDGSWRRSAEVDGDKYAANSSGHSGRCERQVHCLYNMTFNSSKFTKHLGLSDDGVTLSQKGSRKWCTCLSTTIMKPRSGLYKWCVKIENLGRRGHCIFGVATEDVNTGAYLGQDSSGWGLTMNNEVYHSSSRQQHENSIKIGVGSVLEITFDTDDGVLIVSDPTNSSAGSMSSKLSNIGDKELYPAFSLFSPGDAISFLSPMDVSRLGEGVVLSKPSERERLLGYPSYATLEYMRLLFDSVIHVIKSFPPSECVLKVMNIPIISSNLPQLIACLARWEYVPREGDSVHLLHRSLESLLHLFQSDSFRQAKASVAHEGLSNGNRKELNLFSCLSTQLLTIILAYIGRVGSSLIYSEGPMLNNHDIALECSKRPGGADRSFIFDSDATDISAALNEWLQSPLFSKGLNMTEHAATAVAGLADVLGQNSDGVRRKDDLFWMWMFKHDKMSHKIKSIGGSSVANAMQMLFSCLLYHGGYVCAVRSIVDYLETIRDAHSQLQQFIVKEPPFFLMHILATVDKVRLWAMQLHQKQGLSYDQLSTKITGRGQFLMELVPYKSGSISLGYINELFISDSRSSRSMYESQSILSQEEECRKVCNMVVSFVKDNFSLACIRVGLQSASKRAEDRRQGFDMINQALSISGSSGYAGWVHKIALLAHVPLAMRGDSSCLFFTSSIQSVVSVSPAVSPIRGHYMHGLEASVADLRLSTQGAFNSLYSSLSNELLTARHRGEAALILMILDCWGIIIRADDHDMLVRVKIFHAIQDILEDVNPVSEPDIPSSSEDTKLSHTVTRAAMKVLYLLALQVASTGDEEQQRSSSEPLTGPPLVRARSGPSTLSNVVFDMLYNQIQTILSTLRCQFQEQTSNEGARVVCISQDSMVILAEATLLLTCVSKNSSCQGILTKPRWMCLFLELCFYSPPLCQHRALRILSDLIPAASVSSLNLISEDSVHGLYNEEYENESSMATWFVYKLLDICGKVVQNPSIECLIRLEGGSDEQEAAVGGSVLDSVSEAVALIRILLKSPPWNAIVEEALLASISHLNILSSESIPRQDITRSVAAFSVLGGHIESFYAGCMVEIVSSKSDQPKLGIVVSGTPSADLIEVVVASLSDGETGDNYSTFPTAHCAGENSRLVADTSRRTLLVPPDKIKGINRCPLDDTVISKRLVESVLNTIVTLDMFQESACGDALTVPASTSSDQAGTILEEKKDETHIVEEKRDMIQSDSKNSLTTTDSEHVQLSLNYLKFVGYRAISNLVTCEGTADIVHDVIADYMSNDINGETSRPDFIFSMLRMAGEITKSGGLADIPLMESFLTLLISQRQKVWVKQQQQSDLEEKSRANVSGNVSVDPASPLSAGITLGGESASMADTNDARGGYDSSRQSDSPVSGDGEEDNKSDSTNTRRRKWEKPVGFSDIGGIIVQDAEGGSATPAGVEDEASQYRQNLGDDMANMRDFVGDMYAVDLDWQVACAANATEDGQPTYSNDTSSGNSIMVEQLEQMGFPKKWCETALSLCNYDLSEALNYILANGEALETEATSAGGRLAEDDGIIVETKSFPVDVSGVLESGEFSLGMTMGEKNAVSAANTVASIKSPKEYHYLGNRAILHPIYAQPDLSSEKIGVLYPGDDISAIDEIYCSSYQDSKYPLWLKVYYADYQDECDVGEDDYGDECEDLENVFDRQFAWIVTSDDNMRVVLPGPTDVSEIIQPLVDPPSKKYKLDCVMTVVSARGVPVRAAVSPTSPLIGMLDSGTIFTVSEETFTAEGTLCLHVINPLKGWISKRIGQLKVIQVQSKRSDVHKDDVENDDASSSACNKSVPQNFHSEWDLLTKIEDNMELWGGSDVFRKDDRFFGSLQGQEYCVHSCGSESDDGIMHNRRCRVMEFSSTPTVMKELLSQPIQYIDAKIMSTTSSLSNLHCRQAFLAMLLRGMRRRDASTSHIPPSLAAVVNSNWSSVSLPPEEKSSTPHAQESDSTKKPICFSTPCKGEVIAICLSPCGDQESSDESMQSALYVSSCLLSFLRLVLFRGEPYSSTHNLECLALSEIEALGMQKGFLSIESIIGTMLFNFLGKVENRESQFCESIRLLLREGLFGSMVKQIRLACGSNYTEHCWSDPSYTEDADSDCIKHPNVHYAKFVSEILTLLNEPKLTLSVFEAWCCALKSPCMSLKHCALVEIARILDSVSSQSLCTSEEHRNVVSQCLSLVPSRRLHVMAARRLWHEMEDQPAYSRFLSAALELLSVVEALSSDLKIENDGSDIAGSLDGHDSDTAAIRNVVEFDPSSKSSIQLSPYKEIKSSWTLEVWLYVSRANGVVVNNFDESTAISGTDKLDGNIDMKRRDKCRPGRMKPPPRPPSVPSSFQQSDPTLNPSSVPSLPEGFAELRPQTSRGCRPQNDSSDKSFMNFLMEGTNHEESTSDSGNDDVDLEDVVSSRPRRAVSSGFKHESSSNESRGGFVFGSSSSGAYGSRPSPFASLSRGRAMSNNADGNTWTNSAGVAGIRDEVESPAFSDLFQEQHSSASGLFSMTPPPEVFPSRDAPVLSRSAAMRSSVGESRQGRGRRVPLDSSRTSSNLFDTCQSNSRDRRICEEGRSPVEEVTHSSYRKMPQENIHRCNSSVSTSTIAKLSVEPSYLISSSSSYIKIQSGGSLLDDVEDPLQDTDPVMEKALCLSIGQLGESDKAFDYVVPVDKWVHIALASDKSSQSVHLYANGKYQSSVNGRFVLPQSALGHCSLGKSFCGQIAELRIWSTNRTSEELKRDMFANVSECRGLVSLLRFSEGQGTYTVDSVGMSSYRLKNCVWRSVMAPATDKFICPKFMLKETEESEGIFGEGIGESHRVHELTGVIKFGCKIPHYLRGIVDNDGQVICLCYRKVESQEGVIEGYIEWCELDVRCLIRGSLTTDGSLEFYLLKEPYCVILGAPEKLEWCKDLRFKGIIHDGRLHGDIEVSVLGSLSPPIRLGEVRIDESSLNPALAFTREKGRSVETVTVSEGSVSRPHIVLVELLPHARKESFPCEFPVLSQEATEEEVKAAWLEYKTDSEMHRSNSVVDDNSEDHIAETKEDESGTWTTSGATWEDVYTPRKATDNGVCETNTVGLFSSHESVWLDWVASNTTETVLYGVGRLNVLSSEPSLNAICTAPECWSYSSKGIIYHGNAEVAVDNIRKNDKISVEVDTLQGRVAFYRNMVLMYEFYDLLNHEFMSVGDDIEGNSCGLLPFVLLNSAGDGASLMSHASSRDTTRSKINRLKFNDNDLHGRRTFVYQCVDNSANGRAVLSYHFTTGFWCGQWRNNCQHGVQLWVTDVLDDSSDKTYEIKPYLYDNGVSCREMTSIEASPWIDEWAEELDRAVVRMRQQEGSVTALDLYKYINSEFLCDSEGPFSDMTDSKVPGKPQYVLKIIYQHGATVRAGVDIDHSRSIRSLACGDIVEAYSRALTHEGIPRFQICDGWISGRLRGGSEEDVVQILEHHPPLPMKYEVVREGGAKIRQSADMESAGVAICPKGTIIEVTEKKLHESSQGMTMRLRVCSPPEYIGWASEKSHILKLLDPDNSTDSLHSEEIKRRHQIRMKRAEIRAMDEQRLMRNVGCSKCCDITGNITASAETFFLFNKSQCNSGVKVSSDFLSVSCEGRSSGRPMILGSRGFSKGVHYWEVQVDSAQWGSVFIGVAPLDASNWSGYGFINYRATQNSGSETLYGSYYSAGDTVGVLLDMDHGTISFFKDGEDFNVGKTVVINMGVAYHFLRRNHRSPHPALYPCFGLKNSGDQLSIRRCRWASRRGIGPASILAGVLEAKNFLVVWRDFYISKELNRFLVQKIYDAYVRWRQHDLVIVKSRPGIDVAIDTRSDAVRRASRVIADMFPNIQAGTRLRTPYGPGKIVGARVDELWYVLDSEENGAWYWTAEQLCDLVGMGTLGFNVDEENCNVVVSDNDVHENELPTMSFEDFAGSLCQPTSPWSFDEDVALTGLVNTYVDKYDSDPLRISANDLEMYRQRNGILSSKTCSEVQSRYAALCVVNKAAQLALPYLDFGRPAGSLLYTQFDSAISRNFPIERFRPFISRSGSVYEDIKNVIFTRTKLYLWKLAVTETTVFTCPPPDEYERPDEIPEFVLNRMEAHFAREMRESLSFNDRLSKSLFGQLHSALGRLDDISLRRSFVHMQDAGQPRAFYVKFTGEGVDDHGGPYRAVFETAVGEEADGLLEILTPCSNARIRTGENRDQTVLNPQYVNDHKKMFLYSHLGKLIGLACRHDILLSLSLPKLIWKPLSGEPLTLPDLRATDLHVVTSLNAISSGEVPLSDAPDMLLQLLAACGVSPTKAHSLVSVLEFADEIGRNSEYIQQLCSLIHQLKLVSHKYGLQQLYKGMSCVLPAEIFSIFSSAELESLFCGEPEVDISLLQKVTEYEGVSASDRHIAQFWEALQMMSSAELSQFINFCSGRARLPSSAADLPMNFKLTGPPPQSEINPDEYLPIAQTCFFSLSLPKYSSTMVCLNKLKYAIKNATLMDADFVMRNAIGWENIR